MFIHQTVRRNRSEFKINPNGNIVDFGIHRKRRYKEFYAQLILQDFMAYLSRQAYPVDIQP